MTLLLGLRLRNNDSPHRVKVCSARVKNCYGKLKNCISNGKNPAAVARSSNDIWLRAGWYWMRPAPAARPKIVARGWGGSQIEKSRYRVLIEISREAVRERSALSRTRVSGPGRSATAGIAAPVLICQFLDSLPEERWGDSV
jgi:hypothetical protein